MKILEEVVMHEAEADEIVRIFTTPVVQKYLKKLALSAVQDIIQGFPVDHQSDSEYIRKEAHYKGQISVLETLLSITPSNPTTGV